MEIRISLLSEQIFVVVVVVVVSVIVVVTDSHVSSVALFHFFYQVTFASAIFSHTLTPKISW